VGVAGRLPGEHRRAWSIGALRQGTQAFALPPKRVLQLVALADIGAFVAAFVERREQVFGKRFDVAGDELSGEEQAKILSRATGRPINYQEIPIAAASKARMRRSFSNGSTVSATTWRRTLSADEVRESEEAATVSATTLFLLSEAVSWITGVALDLAGRRVRV
jgi:uncharacterized protein YbjT (DUF2867 family)